MNLIKRIAGILALSLVATQTFGIGMAWASSSSDECDASNGDMEITLGNGSALGNNQLYISDDFLVCDPLDFGKESLALSEVKSVTVEMDDEDDSNGVLTIYLAHYGETDSVAALWPEFDTFDIDVTTTLYIYGGDLGTGAGNNTHITIGANTLAFNGAVATSNAPKYDITGGPSKDYIDASKATAKIYVNGGAGNDSLKGGSGKDDLDGSLDLDTIYGGGGNDLIDCGADGDIGSNDFEYGWGEAGDDLITDCVVVAPGSGDDEIDGATDVGSESLDLDGDGTSLLFQYQIVTYADVTGGMEFSLDSVGEVVTGGAAGYDTFNDVTGNDEGGSVLLLTVSGGAGDDVLYSEVFTGSTLKGGAGNDVIKTAGAKAYGGAGNDLIADFGGLDSRFYGEGGNDVLRGKNGDDKLYGGAGSDQGWGGSGADLCNAEVTNRCEKFARRQ